MVVATATLASARALVDRAEELLARHPHEAAGLAWRAEEELSGLQLGAAEELRARAAVVRAVDAGRSGAYQQSLRHGLRAHVSAVALDLHAVAARASNIVGAALDALDQAEEAVTWYSRALEGWKRVGDRWQEARTLGNMGVVWSRLEDEGRALACYESALALAESMGRGHLLVRHRMNAAIGYRRQGRTGDAELALDRCEAALHLADDPEARGYVMAERAELLAALGDAPSALALLDEAEALADAEGLRALHAGTAGARARMLLSTLPVAAAAAALEGLRRAREQDDKHLVNELHDLASRALEAAGSLGEAIQHARAHHAGEAARLRARLDHRLAWLRIQAELDTLQREQVALTEANSELQALVADVEEIMAIVAHDLRAPLMSVQGVAEQLRGTLRRRRTDGELADTLELAVGRAAGILSNLLDSHIIERGRRELVLDAVDLGGLVGELFTVLGGVASRKHATLTRLVAPGLRVWADQGALAQVLGNVLENAIKFGPPGGLVEVEAWPLADEVVVEIRDEGPGFPPEERRRAFQKYGRLAARPTAGESSTGLGLYIVARLVSAMGGRAELDDGPHGGGVVRIVLGAPPTTAPATGAG